MFHRLYELSRCLPQQEAWQRVNEGMRDPYDRGLALCFDPGGDYAGVQVYEGNHGVVYRSGPPNGTDLTPCCKLAKDTPKRLARAIQALADSPGLSADRREWLGAVIRSYEQHLDAIGAAVTTRSAEAGIDGRDRRGYLFLSSGDVTDPVYAWPEARAHMVHQYLERFAKGGVRTGTCAVCGEPGREVYGNFSVLACYNLDKKGSIAGGFSPAEGHRNLPVCGDCALAIGEADNFADAYLTSSMAGQSYRVLPYANAEEVRDELARSLRQHPHRYGLGKVNDLVAEELALEREFAGHGDQLALALVFFKADQASWRIQAEVQQLLPSRLHLLRDASRAIARAPDLEGEKDGQPVPLRMGAPIFSTFSGLPGKPSGETFRTWLVALFEGHAVDRPAFVGRLVDSLIATGRKKPTWLRNTTRQAWGLYRYAALTGLIVEDPITEQDTMQDALPQSPFGRYMNEHPAFFRLPETVAAFLTGCYAAQVASVQRQERGASPFTKKFIGRLLGRRHLKRLYREGHGKLAQYDKLGYVIRGLDPDLAQAWVNCGDRWAISDEEATFAFTIGYSLAYRIHQLDQRPAPEEDPA